MLSQFTAQQASLRDAVTSGSAAGLASFREAGAEFGGAQARLAPLARGDQPMTARLNAMMAAYRTWQASVAAPQLADVDRGDLAAARVLQADTKHTSPLVLAVRTSAQALESQIIGEQQQVTNALNSIHQTLLGALIAMIVVVAVIATQIIMGVRRGMVRPFGQLSKAVAAVADGRYHRSIPVVGPAEIADLSRGVELMRTRLVAGMAERERAAEGLRNLFDLAPDAMVAVAGDGLITMANAKAVQVFGYTVGELVGRPADTLVPQDWRENMAAQSASYFADRRSTADWPGDQGIRAAPGR